MADVPPTGFTPNKAAMGSDDAQGLMVQAASPPDATLALPAYQCRVKDVPVDDLHEAPFSDAAGTRTAVEKSIAGPSPP